MRKVLVVIAVLLSLFSSVAYGSQTTIGVGAKIGNAGAFVIANSVAGNLGLEAGIGTARVGTEDGSFDELVPSGFLDVKGYYQFMPGTTEALFSPYVGAGVQVVHYNQPVPYLGNVTVTAVAAEVVSGVDIHLSSLKIPITLVFAAYAHVIRGAIASYAGGTTTMPFGTKVPRGFQLGIRIDF